MFGMFDVFKNFVVVGVFVFKDRVCIVYCVV